jgi:hypothetical protein
MVGDFSFACSTIGWVGWEIVIVVVLLLKSDHVRGDLNSGAAFTEGE